MGRSPCCDKANVKKGPWSAEEDLKLREYIEKNGTGGNWITLPQRADLKRCGKSCRLRWLNYLRPNINHGRFSSDEDMVICRLYANLGSRWSIIAAHLPGRTDNDIKNYWNTKLKKKFSGMSIPPHQSSHHHHHNNKNNFQSSTNTNYYTPSPSVFKSLSGESNLEPSSFVVLNSPNMSSSCITSTISQPQLHHQQYYDQLQVQDANYVMVGGEAASSTTSSEASFGNYNNQISSGGNNYQWTNQKLITEMLDENSLEYFGIEELKKLIGISTTNVDNNNNNLFVDEDRILGVKEEEASIYY